MQKHKECTNARGLSVLELSVLPRDSVVGWGTMLQAGRSRARIPIMFLGFFQFT
jgi:hypothetical protein